MWTYAKGVLAGLAAAIGVALLAWASGLGPRVTTRTVVPTTSAAPAPTPSPDKLVVNGRSEIISESETDIAFPRSEQAVVLLAFVVAAVWQLRRDRRR
jgi:hypothetical protein